MKTRNNLKNVNIYFNNIHFHTCIGAPLPYMDDQGSWYISDSGEPHFLKLCSDTSYQYCDNHVKSLANDDEILEYIRWGFEQYNDHGYVDELQDIVLLALYPHFFGEDGSNVTTVNLLCAIYNNLFGTEGNTQLCTFLKTIFVIDDGACDYLKHCLPLQLSSTIGLLTVFGLHSQAYWGNNHRRALIEGWKFQLHNPALIYPNVIGPDLSTAFTFVLSTALKNEDLEALLHETGLTKHDLKVAYEIATKVHIPSVSSIEEIFLSELSYLSNLNINRPLPVSLGPIDLFS